ncbi:hypothetical protein PANT_9d00322 [Moesziomyces antarcticus T-34]|uniref:Uncharacterized protein n=1 Tax=Pseudozyma antarctica (strain T-34) TaxID=1151754 RepID=M9M1J3_PSEA3|nr:hypothetical protein PANT_9d00322 [Moesziomyces antarcticus T-34]
MGLSIGQGAAAAAAAGAAAVDCCLLLPAAAGCCLDSPALQLRLVRPRLPRIVPSHRPPSINLDTSPPTLIPLSPSHAWLSPGPELAHLHFRLPAYELLLDLASLALDRPWTSKHLQFIEQQAGLHLDPIASTDTLHIADDPPFCLVFATRSARSPPL